MYHQKKALYDHRDDQAMAALAKKVREHELPAIRELYASLRLLQRFYDTYHQTLSPHMQELLQVFGRLLSCCQAKTFLKRYTLKDVLEQQAVCLQNRLWKDYKKAFEKETRIHLAMSKILYEEKNEKRFLHTISPPVREKAKGLLGKRGSIIASTFALLVFFSFATPLLPRTQAAPVRHNQLQMNAYLQQHEKEVALLQSISSIDERDQYAVAYTCIQLKDMVYQIANIRGGSEQEVLATILSTVSKQFPHQSFSNIYTNIRRVQQRLPQYIARFNGGKITMDWKASVGKKLKKDRIIEQFVRFVLFEPDSLEDHYRFLEKHDLHWEANIQWTLFIPAHLDWKPIALFHQYFPIKDKTIRLGLWSALQITPPHTAQPYEVIEQKIKKFKKHFGMIPGGFIATDARWQTLFNLFCTTHFVESLAYGKKVYQGDLYGSFDFLRMTTTQDTIRYLSEIKQSIHGTLSEPINIERTKQVFDQLDRLGFRTRYPSDLANIIIHTETILQHGLAEVVAKYGITYFSAFSMDMLTLLRDKEQANHAHQQKVLYVLSKPDSKNYQSKISPGPFLNWDVAVIEVGGEKDFVHRISKLGGFDVIIFQAHGSQFRIQFGSGLYAGQTDRYVKHTQQTQVTGTNVETNEDAFFDHHDDAVMSLVAGHLNQNGVVFFNSCKNGITSEKGDHNLVTAVHNQFRSIGRKDLSVVGAKNKTSNLRFVIGTDGALNHQFLGPGGQISSLVLGPYAQHN